MTNEDHYRKLENMMNSAPIVKLIGAKAEIAEGKAKILLPVKRELHHAASALHGAMYFLVLDNAAFFAANSLIDDALVLTMTFNINFFKPVSDGIVRGEGHIVNQSGKHFFAESVLYNSSDEVIAKGAGIFVRSQIKLSPDIGYR